EQRAGGGLEIGRVPHRIAEPEVVSALQHGVGGGELLRVEVEGIDRGGIGAIEPDGGGGQVALANGGQVGEHLRLVAVLVAPEPGAERPGRRQYRVPGDVVIMAGYIERALGGEEVEGEAVGALLGG